jgi:hypothetical protein
MSVVPGVASSVMVPVAVPSERFAPDGLESWRRKVSSGSLLGLLESTGTTTVCTC